MTSTADELRLVAVTGNLGYGYRVDSLNEGISRRPHLFGADNGSTDPGPYYLGSGGQLTKPTQVRRDLRGALLAARSTGAPLVIGSAGTAGGEPHLASLLAIVHEVAEQEGLHFHAAAIHAEIDQATVHAALQDGRVLPLPGVGALTHEAVSASDRIVGQMGVEPFIEALKGGADVIIAGRACDTAIYAALPIMRGFDPGLSYHLAKILECGAQAALPLAANDCMLGIIRHDHFLVTPLAPDRLISTASVAAHTMYEQSDPTRVVEPDGYVDLSLSVFEQIDERTVRVSSSAWVPAKTPSTKLEGARHRGFRTIAIAGVRDPLVIQNLAYIEKVAAHAVAQNLNGLLSPDSYQLRILAYGRDAVMGEVDAWVGVPHELGLVLEAMADTQDNADVALALFRSSILHCPFPGRKSTAGNLAFPYSPSDISLGPAYEFSIYHRMVGERSPDLFRVEHFDV